MKPRSRVPGFFVVRVLLAAGSLGLVTTAARAQENEIDIGVRSTIVDKPLGHSKSSMQDAKPHGKIYGIVLVKQVTTEQKLVKPVDESAIIGLLSTELNTHGYKLVPAGQIPEIVLTVYYGRGYLNNPFLRGAGHEMPAGVGSASLGTSGTGGGTAPADAPTYNITGVGEQLFRNKGNGYEAKLQKAQYEKLYIRVAAWAYPSDPKAKTKQLWNTTMIVDDPEHRDLNAVAEKMIKAGVAYFDHEMKDEEVDVYQPLPEGKVNVGTPEVVPPKAH